MLDVARNFRPLEDVLRLLDLMSLYKLNKLHLHLTDDEGWRLQIPGLVELTQVGGQRCHDLEEQSCLLPFLGSGPSPAAPGSGFYTVEDYKTILRYAADRYIQVIPEVQMPGHAHAAIKAMEARRKRLQGSKNVGEAKKYLLADDDDESWYQSYQLFTDNAMNPCLDSTYEFIAHVVRSLVEMHSDVTPLQLLHVGGKGVAEGAWTNSSVCRELLSSDFDFRKYKDLKEYFVKKVSGILQEEGLNLGAWEAGLMQSGRTPYARAPLQNNKVYAYAWHNVWEEGTAQRAYTLANAGYKVIMAQATHLFFDHAYEPDPEERGAYWATRFTDTKKTFSFMPSDLYANADVTRSGDPMTPEMMCGERGNDCVELKEAGNIVGIQGSLWTDVVRTREQADFMLFPRFFALAERAWHMPRWEEETTDNVTRLRELQADWSAFANTLGYRELPRLDRKGVQYRVPPPGAK
ncbi:beta-hexosaminidase-like [Babylonia areolata]|uniref:beta-hexosaminidase-like n=1 Tax=Babylonia areolata TaxID=304850 RepID=UPI003FD5CF2E